MGPGICAFLDQVNGGFLLDPREELRDATAIVYDRTATSIRHPEHGITRPGFMGQSNWRHRMPGTKMTQHLHVQAVLVRSP